MSWTIAADCLLAAAKRKVRESFYIDKFTKPAETKEQQEAEVAVFNDAKGVILSILEFVHNEPNHHAKVNVLVTGVDNRITDFRIGVSQFESE